jgi:hypothetical protein
MFYVLNYIFLVDYIILIQWWLGHLRGENLLEKQDKKLDVDREKADVAKVVAQDTMIKTYVSRIKAMNGASQFVVKKKERGCEGLDG